MAGRWFSPGTTVSSTNKTDRHDITEILLKVVLNTKTLTFITKSNNFIYVDTDLGYLRAKHIHDSNKTIISIFILTSAISKPNISTIVIKPSYLFFSNWLDVLNVNEGLRLDDDSDGRSTMYVNIKLNI